MVARNPRVVAALMSNESAKPLTRIRKTVEETVWRIVDNNLQV